MPYDNETIATSVAQYLADRNIFISGQTLREAIEQALPPPTPAIETDEAALAAAKLVADALADPKYVETPLFDPVKNAVTLDRGGSVTDALKDPAVVYFGMLRGGIAKLSHGQVASLYRGESADLIYEIKRQSMFDPEAA